jgi:YHS domain-containing protein
MKTMTVRFGQALLLGVLLLLCGAFSASSQTIYADDKGVAIKGYDAVAYFTDSKPVEGKSDIAYKWKGAKWHFISAEHRDMFKADPEKYAPQYGGFCAFGVCKKNAKFPTDPTAWKIIEGKLYLNYNQQTQDAWTKSLLPGTITNGDVNWQSLNKTTSDNK